MKRLAIVRIAAFAGMAAVVAPVLTGCYGSFGLTRQLYRINGDLGNKWIKSGFVLVLGWTYGITGLADAVVFNLIEFWTGKNPIASKDGRFEQVATDGTRVEGRILPDGRLDATVTSPDGKVARTVLERTPDGVTMTDADGVVVGRLAVDPHGKTLLLTPRVN